jgi:hypothetical protein
VCLITGQAVKIGGKSVGVYQAVSTSKEIKDKQQFKQKQENKQTDSKEKSVTSQTRKEISSQELQRLFDE